jgi:hypothetical protein
MTLAAAFLLKALFHSARVAAPLAALWLAAHPVGASAEDLVVGVVGPLSGPSAFPASRLD